MSQFFFARISAAESDFERLEMEGRYDDMYEEEVEELEELEELEPLLF